MACRGPYRIAPTRLGIWYGKRMARLPVATALLLVLVAACADPLDQAPPAAPVSSPPPESTVAAAPPAPEPVATPSSPPPRIKAAPEPAKGPRCATLPPEECGHWEPASIERWRVAMTGYTSAVTRANQRPIGFGSSARALADYLNQVHNRLHPWFTERFLASLDRPPKDPRLEIAIGPDGRNAPGVVAGLEIAISPDGRIARMGVVRSSGALAFDAAALESFARAAPFGATPEETRSADGNLWMHWELHRDEVYGCSAMNARPFMLTQ